MIFAGNWKLNLGPKEVKLLLNELKSKLSNEEMKSCFFFPQNLSLSAALETREESSFLLGSQNIHSKSEGAFTGENSIKVLEEVGAELALVGHSERRNIFGETDSDLNEKMLACVDSKIIPMLCIGEKLEERESSKTNSVLDRQLSIALAGFPTDKQLYIAYEPVWAIGTGKVASPEMAEDAHAYIRKWLEENFSKDKSDSTMLLYGGSVKAENAGDLSKMPNIDGFLIGGASLKAESFVGIIKNSK